MKKIIKKILSYCFDFKKENDGCHNLHLKNIKKILFVRYDGKIGDYIVSSFVYREIKKQYPDIQIDIICTELLKTLIEKNPHIDTIYTIKKLTYSEILSHYKLLSANHYDLLVDLSEVIKDKNLLFIRLINAKVNYGYNNNFKIFNKKLPGQQTQTSGIYKSCLEDLGLQHVDTQYDIPEPENHIRPPQNKPVVTLNLFGAAKRKKFTLENALLLIDKIKTTFPDHLLYLQDSPPDHPLIKKILSAGGTKFYYSEAKSILDTIALIKISDLVISPDTSTVHIANGLNKKIIAFYLDNKKDFESWGIDREKHQVIFYQDNINTLDIKNINFQKK